MLYSFEQSLLSSNFKLGKGNKLFQEQERLVINNAFFSSSTQRQIIDKTKIPQQTVSRIVKSLLERKVLKQTNRKSTGSRGQPGYHLTCNPDYAYNVGIAILTDSIAVSVMNFEGNIIFSRQQELTNMSVNNVITHLRKLFDEALVEADILTDNILGIGVAISGYFIDIKNKINTHNMLNEWAELNIAKLISTEFQHPVWVENDGTAAAAGEGIVGIGKQVQNFVYLFISTAFGGGIIINSDVMRGTHGNAGELGDMIPPKIFMHPNLENLRRILLKNGQDVQTVRELIDSFDISWTGNNEWVYKVKDAVNLVASSAAALLDTQAIVIGGHIPKELALLLIKEIEIYAQYRRSSSRPVPEIVVAQTEFEPVSTGAASIPFRALCL